MASPTESKRAVSNIRYAREDNKSITASDIYRVRNRNNHRAKILEAVNNLNDFELTKVSELLQKESE